MSTKSCIIVDPWLTLTNLMAMSNLAKFAFIAFFLVHI